MNTNTKKIIGAAIGGAVGYFVGSVIVEYLKLKERDPWEKVMNIGTEDITERTKMDDKPTNKKRDYTEHFIARQRPDLAELAAKYNGNPAITELDTKEVDKDIFETVYALERDIDDSPQPIRVISMIEYANDDQYEHLTYNYYDDDILTDGINDRPIENFETLIGDEALVSFGQESEDEDVVYIINDNTKQMFEIVRTNKEYAVTKVRKARRQAMSKKEEKNEKNEEDVT